jgi:predicted XRE-type DNA-binding protein
MSAKVEKRSERGSGNVFADLGLPQADELLRKAELIRLIAASIQARGLTQSAAARRARIAQPDLSKLLRGQSEGFSYDRLLRILAELGNDVEVTIRTAQDPSHAGRVRVLADVD